MSAAVWQQMLDNLARTLDPQRVETWFRPLRVGSQAPEGTLLLIAPNRFVADFLTQHYRDALVLLARSISPSITTVQIQPAPSLSADSPAEQAAPQISPRSTLNKRFIFDSFVVGSGNEFARSAALAVAESPGKTKFNPLLIYGGVGLGKTHLLQAIGNLILATDPNARITYITSEEFCLTFIEAIKNNDTKTFTARFRMSDVLLVDDVQYLAGKESTQEEFFFIFNSLYQNGKQIVLTSDLPPASLRGLQERLVSRFQWGLAVDIQPPNLETRVAILKRKAEDEKLDLSEEILYYIAECFSSNIRELEGAVLRLLAFASISKCDITLETVKSVLKAPSHRQPSRISVERIIERVAEFYGIPVNHMREKNRHKEVAHARQIAMYIAKSVTNHSLKSIGLNFGGRDHSTVIHAVTHVEQLKNTDPVLARQIEQIIGSL